MATTSRMLITPSALMSAFALYSANFYSESIFNLERSFSCLGKFYNIITSSGDIMAVIVLVSCLIFIFRRIILKIKRFSGREIKKSSSVDAALALFIIIFLMISLISMNVAYIGKNSIDFVGFYPFSNSLINLISTWNINNILLLHDISWWTHIMLVLIFLNELPYSKHFHVVMSIPNVYFSNIENLGKIDNMPIVTKEIKSLMNPNLNVSSRFNMYY